MGINPYDDIHDAAEGRVPFTEHAVNVSLLQMEEAKARMLQDSSKLPTWFSSRLRYVLGPIDPLGLTVVAARPGCGKTSFMLAQARHMVKTGHRILFIGTETPGWRLRTQIAAQECQLPLKYVVQGRWDELGAGSREKVFARMEAFDKDTEGRWFIAPEDRVDHNRLLEYIYTAGEQGATVFIDHLHEVDWGGGAGDLTSAMAIGLRQMKDAAKEANVRIIAAAQIKRFSKYDALADYMVPDQGSIKQCGVTEEVSSLILLMHRALKENATELELKLVRQGQKQKSQVIDEGVSVVVIGKDRIGGETDKQVRLHVGNGELFDSAELRRDAYGAMDWMNR